MLGKVNVSLLLKLVLKKLRMLSIENRAEMVDRGAICFETNGTGDLNTSSTSRKILSDASYLFPDVVVGRFH